MAFFHQFCSSICKFSFHLINKTPIIVLANKTDLLIEDSHISQLDDFLTDIYNTYEVSILLSFYE